MQRIKFQKKKEEDRRCIGAMEGGNCSKLVVYTERNNTHDRLTALKKKNKKLKKNNDDKFRSRKIHEN